MQTYFKSHCSMSSECSSPSLINSGIFWTSYPHHATQDQGEMGTNLSLNFLTMSLRVLWSTLLKQKRKKRRKDTTLCLFMSILSVFHFIDYTFLRYNYNCAKRIKQNVTLPFSVVVLHI